MTYYWVIAAFLVGVAVGHLFWTQIQQWARKTLGYMLDNIDRTVNAFSDAFVTLVKGKAGQFFKKLIVVIRDINAAVNEDMKVRYTEEPISRAQIPAEILAQIDQRAEELTVLQLENQR